MQPHYHCVLLTICTRKTTNIPDLKKKKTLHIGISSSLGEDGMRIKKKKGKEQDIRKILQKQKD